MPIRSTTRRSVRPEPSQITDRAPLRPTLTEAVRTHLGDQLRELYEAIEAEAPPPRLIDLIDRLDRLSPTLEAPSYATFRNDLLAVLPGLRAFALSLAGGAAQADDLVQETLLKAWQNQNSYRPGTNLKAWVFTILRNHFYSERRKRKREVDDADGLHAGRMTALPDQEDNMELRQVWAKLTKLPTAQREALLLVGAQGLTYEDAAELIGCQVGTVKSRVSRGRSDLAHALGFTEGRLSRASA